MFMHLPHAVSLLQKSSYNELAKYKKYLNTLNKLKFEFKVFFFESNNFEFKVNVQKL